MLCTAEFVSSPTLPVNSGSFSGYSLKAVSSGTGAPASSSGFCFLLWLRLAAFPCLPSASSSCSRPSAGCKEIGVSNHQGSGLHLDGALPPSHPRASSCHRERLNIVRGEVFPLWGVQLKERACEPLSTAGTTLGVNAWLELCRHLLPLSAQAYPFQHGWRSGAQWLWGSLSCHGTQCPCVVLGQTDLPRTGQVWDGETFSHLHI